MIEIATLTRCRSSSGYRARDFQLSFLSSPDPRGQVVPYISSRLNLIAAGFGIAVVAASLQHVKIEGVTFLRLKGSAQLKAPLSLAFRRGDPSPVVRQFLKLAKRTARNFHVDDRKAS